MAHHLSWAISILDGPVYYWFLGELTPTKYSARYRSRTVTIINVILAEAMTTTLQDQLWDKSVHLCRIVMLQMGQNRGHLLHLLMTLQDWHPIAIEWAEYYYDHLLVAFTRQTLQFNVPTAARRPDHTVNYTRLIARDAGKCPITGLWSAYCPEAQLPTGAGVILPEMAHIIPHCLNNNHKFHAAAFYFAGINPQLLAGQQINDARNFMNIDRTFHITMDDRFWGLEPIPGSDDFAMVHVVGPARYFGQQSVPHGSRIRFGIGDPAGIHSTPAPHFLHLALKIAKIF